MAHLFCIQTLGLLICKHNPHKQILGNFCVFRKPQGLTVSLYGRQLLLWLGKLEDGP